MIFLSLKNEVKVPAKSNKEKIFFWRLEGFLTEKEQDPELDTDPNPKPDPLVAKSLASFPSWLTCSVELTVWLLPEPLEEDPGGEGGQHQQGQQHSCTCQNRFFRQ